VVIEDKEMTQLVMDREMRNGLWVGSAFDSPFLRIVHGMKKLIKQRLEPVMDTLEIQYRSEYDSVLSVQTRIVGIAV